ncbi:Gfo/Idh/MocA family protein [Metabacillus halosaccharovorans]|uniref:Gfo/Idh/MocA family oxidoreductase n=1 Tax=Metabacillus halosaccharovorans TaxID=930124 RepID=A0ABT3DCR3_9BACI|nr:Gfo/Idh/MocA family oxidoreductase [Metabacillus halosaccharovorans]MCV9884671.1 Gfo/Idh/MocA family oxidoreductase [Metabacillus halosaccharovorans]
MKPLKLGFIGGGIRSAVGNTHRIASQMDNRWIVEAGCFSKNNDINIETANEYRVDNKRVYNSWEGFLEGEKGKLDAVCILTPTDIHSEMVVRALDLGYAVICEKALSSTLEEAGKIANAVKRNKGFLAVTYNYTGYPILRELRNMIRNGKLGRINQIHIEMPQEGFLRLDRKGQVFKPQNWRLKDGNIPTISLDLGVHLHHLVYFLTEEKPLEVVADQCTYGHFDVIDNVMCLARYTGGLRSQIWYSKSALGHRNGLRVRIYGEEGSAEWYQMYPEELKFYDNLGRTETLDRSNSVLVDEPRYNRFKSGHPAGFIEAFANHYYDIAESLIEFNKSGAYQSSFVFNERVGIEGLKMLEAVSISSRDRKWVNILDI